MANEKCKSYLNHVSPNNKSVLYNLSSCPINLFKLKKRWSLTLANIYHKSLECELVRPQLLSGLVRLFLA